MKKIFLQMVIFIILLFIVIYLIDEYSNKCTPVYENFDNIEIHNNIKKILNDESPHDYFVCIIPAKSTDPIMRVNVDIYNNTTWGFVYITNHTDDDFDINIKSVAYNKPAPTKLSYEVASPSPSSVTLSPSPSSVTLSPSPSSSVTLSPTPSPLSPEPSLSTSPSPSSINLSTDKKIFVDGDPIHESLYKCIEAVNGQPYVENNIKYEYSVYNMKQTKNLNISIDDLSNTRMLIYIKNISVDKSFEINYYKNGKPTTEPQTNTIEPQTTTTVPQTTTTVPQTKTIEPSHTPDVSNAPHKRRCTIL